MRIGIVGLPASGKSTIFKALTGARADAGGGRRDQPNVAVVRVPDERIDTLVPMFKPKRTVYATVEFMDIGGLGSGGGADGPRRDLSPALLAAARQVDALAIVLGAHLPGADPASDLAEIELELQFADLAVIERRLERLASDLKKAPTADRPALARENELLARLRDGLAEERPIRDLEIAPEDEKLLRGYGFLSAKPAFTILNVAEDALGGPPPMIPEARRLPAETIAGGIEAEIAELEPEDAAAFLADLGIERPGIDRVIQVAYRATNLISFFTVGPDEVRAWPVPDGATALEAAGAIHTDIARGLIRAEVVAYGDLIAAGGLTEARRAGVLRVEGKTYPVRDGEICHFLSNV